MGTLDLRPVRVAVDGSGESGLLVFNGELLIAVLTYLSDPVYGDAVDHWFLEAGFGACATRQQVFVSAEAALQWVGERLEPNVR